MTNKGYYGPKYTLLVNFEPWSLQYVVRVIEFPGFEERAEDKFDACHQARMRLSRAFLHDVEMPSPGSREMYESDPTID